jgi:hypothetical protein
VQLCNSCCKHAMTVCISLTYVLPATAKRAPRAHSILHGIWSCRCITVVLTTMRNAAVYTVFQSSKRGSVVR